MSDVTGSIATDAPARADTDPQRGVEAHGERYRANPKDAGAAIAYGQALRSNGQHAQAAAVLEQANIANPGNKALLAAWGRALVDNGNFQEAFDVLSRAHTPDNPDWRILSVQGTALDQLGRHDEARRYYANALKVVPGEPSVLSSLCQPECRRAGAAESGAGGWLAGPLQRCGNHRQGRPAARRGGGQCRLPQGDAEGQGKPALGPQHRSGGQPQPAGLVAASLGLRKAFASRPTRCPRDFLYKLMRFLTAKRHFASRKMSPTSSPRP
jgi:tetratricopeptide (TPR) repeat protein